jgi:hypothetical protein
MPLQQFQIDTPRTALADANTLTASNPAAAADAAGA